MRTVQWVPRRRRPWSWSCLPQWPRSLSSWPRGRRGGEDDRRDYCGTTAAATAALVPRCGARRWWWWWWWRRLRRWRRLRSRRSWYDGGDDSGDMTTRGGGRSPRRVHGCRRTAAEPCAAQPETHASVVSTVIQQQRQWRRGVAAPRVTRTGRTTATVGARAQRLSCGRRTPAGRVIGRSAVYRSTRVPPGWSVTSSATRIPRGTCASARARLTTVAGVGVGGAREGARGVLGHWGSRFSCCSYSRVRCQWVPSYHFLLSFRFFRASSLVIGF